MRHSPPIVARRRPGASGRQPAPPASESDRFFRSSLSRLDPQNGSVGLAAARSDLRRNVQQTVGTLLHIADADTKLRQQGFPALGLRRLVERHSLKLQAVQSAY